MPKLELYYKPTCPYCRKVLGFMKENNISIELKDVDSDPALRPQLQEIGGKVQVPCLVIDGKPLYESDDIITWMKENLIK